MVIVGLPLAPSALLIPMPPLLVVARERAATVPAPVRAISPAEESEAIASSTAAHACTWTPISSPRLTRASAADVPPVPPIRIDKTSVASTTPPTCSKIPS